MHHIELVKEYLRDKGIKKSITPSGLPFITISREAGAGGHLLAHVIVTDLMKEIGEIYRGWEVCDKDIFHMMGQDKEINASVNDLMTEKMNSEWFQFVNGLFSGREDEYMHHKMSFNVIRLIAALGKVVIVGRAGAFVTAGIHGGIHIRLVARESARIRWMMKKFNINQEQAEKMVKEQDHDKKKLVQTFFHADIADPLHYHCVWNTEMASMHEISRAVINIIKMRFTKE